jgi:predicted nucleic acid-binding protein
VSAVVSDTSPLHYLVECEAIEILPALFREVIIPPTVHRELQHSKTPVPVRAWGKASPHGFEFRHPRRWIIL